MMPHLCVAAACDGAIIINTNVTVSINVKKRKVRMYNCKQKYVIK